MNRLQSELRRLFAPGADALPPEDAPLPPLVSPEGQVRAMVLELKRPPSWELLATVWQGVQAELGLPAPAIAVSGVDALQLWFSLQEPVAVQRAHGFLLRLSQRFLQGVEPRRLRLLPDPALPASSQHAPWVPAAQGESGQWSAFLAPDLAPVFADTPWLDMPPNEEGQASLLRGVQPMAAADFEAARDRLAPTPPEALAAQLAARQPAAPPQAAPAPTGSPLAPREFLMQVMNDTNVAMALRIEAARVLLMHPGPTAPGG